MSVYLEGHAKRNPETGELALRTQFPEEDFPHLAWLVSTTTIGPRNASTADVEAWEDLFVPEEPDE